MVILPTVSVLIEPPMSPCISSFEPSHFKWLTSESEYILIWSSAMSDVNEKPSPGIANMIEVTGPTTSINASFH
jgi:hypothetical protein